MKVTLIGHTQFYLPERAAGTELADRLYTDAAKGAYSEDADALAEFAGRICYDSFNLPNPGTRSNAEYLANILKQQHFSVLEHASATFLIEGVSRSLLMELRTHRHTSFSARSTRYVDEKDAQFVTPPALAAHLTDRLTSEDDISIGDDLDDLMGHATSLYDSIEQYLVGKGLTRKQAREAAREFLPGATETEFVVTANHNAWRQLLAKRIAPGAAQEIQNLAKELLSQLKPLAPGIYQDMQCP